MKCRGGSLKCSRSRISLRWRKLPSIAAVGHVTISAAIYQSVLIASVLNKMIPPSPAMPPPSPSLYSKLATHTYVCHLSLAFDPGENITHLPPDSIRVLQYSLMGLSLSRNKIEKLPASFGGLKVPPNLSLLAVHLPPPLLHHTLLDLLVHSKSFWWNWSSTEIN